MEHNKSKDHSDDDIEIIQEPVTQTHGSSDNFILMLQGPTLDIKKMKGHYRKFAAWKIQWNAYLISSGLGRLQKQHTHRGHHHANCVIKQTKRTGFWKYQIIKTLTPQVHLTLLLGPTVIFRRSLVAFLLH